MKVWHALIKAELWELARRRLNTARPLRYPSHAKPDGV
jgi:hypothetical protein